MANDAQKALKEAAQAYKAGDRQKAQGILLDLVSKDETNEKAWLLLSAVVDTLEDREVALENVITLNPGNEKARKGLELVRQKMAAKKPREPLGGAGWSDIDTDTVEQHEHFGWDGAADKNDDKNPFAPSDSPPITEQIDWGGVPQPDTSSTSSVDWGTSDDSSPAAYGSGQQIDQPSESEYDNMIGGLGLPGGNATTESSDESGWGDIDPSAIFNSAPTSTSDSTEDWGDAGWGGSDAATSDADTTTDPFASFDEPASAQPATTEDDPFAGWESTGEAASSDPASASEWGTATSSDDEPWAEFGGWDEPDVTATPAATPDVVSSTDDSFGDWDSGANQTDSGGPAGDWGSWGAADESDPFGTADDSFASNEPAAQGTGFGAADDPFGSDDDPFASSQPAAQSSGFGIASDSFGTSDDPFGSDDDSFASNEPAAQGSGFDAADDPFGSDDDPFASSQPAAQSSGFEIASDDDPFADSQPPTQASGFGVTDDPFGSDDDPFGAADNPFAGGAPALAAEKPQKKSAGKKAKQKAATPAIDPKYAEYFKLIPTEIEAPASPLAGNSTVLIGIVVLLLLNVAAILSIVTQL